LDHARLQMEDVDSSRVAGSAMSENVVEEEAHDEVQGEVQEDTMRASQCPAIQMEEPEHVNTAESAVSKIVVQEEVQEDTLRASQRPALEDVRELLGSVSNGDTTPDADETGLVMSETVHGAESSNLLTTFTPDTSSPQLDHEGGSDSLKETMSSREDIPGYSLPDLLSPIAPKPSSPTPQLERPFLQISEVEAVVHDTDLPSPSKVEARTISPERVNSNAESAPSLLHAVMPRSTSAAKSRRPKQLLDALSPSGSPQIGTSLLRRESLRRMETPSKKRELRKPKGPKKRDTLSRRDTLQEREILQKVIAETSQDPNPENADLAIVEASAPSSDDLVAKIEQTEHDEQQIGSGTGADEEHTTNDAVTGAESPVPASDDAKAEKDLHRAMEAIEVFEHPTKSDAIDISLPASDVEAEEMKAIDNANEMIAEAELEEASRKTRSGARFSDDTSMLRDFLNRAQASKAAKTPLLSRLDAPNPQTSPRRSPRKALGPRKGNASTPQKLGDIANRPSTPPGMPKAAILDSDDAEEMTATPTSCRRSTRTRLPAPSKAPPGAPSFIPVRRADGTDPVVLQKSQAQEIAMVTRANTRRNKGQSKPPLLALKDVPAGSAELATAKQHAESAKSVGWAERLASYQDPKEQADEVEENKPKVRRMRGLGVVNGTPAPKKSTAVVGTSNGTPARRGRVR